METEVKQGLEGKVNGRKGGSDQITSLMWILILFRTGNARSLNRMKMELTTGEVFVEKTICWRWVWLVERKPVGLASPSSWRWTLVRRARRRGGKPRASG